MSEYIYTNLGEFGGDAALETAARTAVNRSAQTARRPPYTKAQMYQRLVQADSILRERLGLTSSSAIAEDAVVLDLALDEAEEVAEKIIDGMGNKNVRGVVRGILGVLVDASKSTSPNPFSDSLTKTACSSSYSSHSPSLLSSIISRSTSSVR